MLVRRTGLDAAGGAWAPLEHLTGSACPTARPPSLLSSRRSVAPIPARRRHGRLTGSTVAPPPIRPAGFAPFAVEVAPPGDLGAVLVGRTVLYRDGWPDDGRQRGTIARLCPRGAFSRVVAFNRQTSALRTRCSTPPPTLPLDDSDSLAGPRRRVRPVPDPEFEFVRRLRLVTAPGPGPGGQPTFA